MTELPRSKVCGICGHAHTTDLTSPSASGCADHSWTDACPYYGTACPPTEERERITADLSSRMGGHLDDAFRGLPVTYQDIVEVMRKIGDSPPTWRTEPIKLTPGQWAWIQAANPPLDRPLCQPLGDILGVPVVMVDSDAKSTPVVEGWLKPKRWWSRLRSWWQREAR